VPPLRQDRHEMNSSLVAGGARSSAPLPRPKTLSRDRHFHPISREKIVRAAHRIAEAVHPEKVILFGSYAYGHPTADSDVDFLIVHPARTRSQRMNVAIKASTALEPRPFPVDILVRSAQKIRQRVKMGDGFLQEISQRGRVVYER
jgi:predicted nucleotidyltransferase